MKSESNLKNAARITGWIILVADHVLWVGVLEVEAAVQVLVVQGRVAVQVPVVPVRAVQGLEALVPAAPVREAAQVPVVPVRAAATVQVLVEVVAPVREAEEEAPVREAEEEAPVAGVAVITVPVQVPALIYG